MNVAIWTIIFGSVGLVGSLFEWRGKFLGWIARIWSKLILKIGGIKFSVQGLKKLDSNGHYIFASNHESALDIPLVFAGLPYHIVSISKIELKYIPIFGWAMMAGGHFFVDRQNHKKAIQSLDRAKKSMIKNPRSIIIYPEGTRSSDGSILPFKKGGLIMALKMGLPVVPIAIIGTRESMQKKRLSLKKQPLELRIGEPIKTSKIDYNKRNEFVNQVRNAVVTLKFEQRINA